MRNMIMIKNKKYKTYLYKTLHGSVIYIYIYYREKSSHYACIWTYTQLICTQIHEPLNLYATFNNYIL